MRDKRNLIYSACIIAMLVIVPTAFGDIYTVSDWWSNVSGDGIVVGGFAENVFAVGTANAQHPSSLGGCVGWTETYTTESGYFDWWAFLWGQAWAQITLHDNELVSADAWGIASAEGPGDEGEVWMQVGGSMQGSTGQVYSWHECSGQFGDYVMAYDQYFEADVDCVATECTALVWVRRHSGGGQDRADASAQGIAYTGGMAPAQ